MMPFSTVTGHSSLRHEDMPIRLVGAHAALSLNNPTRRPA
jgi:hypothetical protein